MGYGLDIAEVGAAEYPLIEVLRETIFGEFGHLMRTPVAQTISGREDLLALIAHQEGNPCGFSAGYRRNAEVFYVVYVGVLREFRGLGLGRQMMQRHEAFAAGRGYRQIEFNTYNHFPGMMRLGLSMGYRPIGLEQHELTHQDLAIRFGKRLAGEDGIQPKRLPALEAAEVRVPVDDAGQLRARIEEGMAIRGMVQDPESRRMRIVLSQPLA